MLLYIFLIILLLFLFQDITLFQIEKFQSNDCSKPIDKRKCLYKFNGKWTTCPTNSLYPNERCYQCPWKRPYLNHKSREHCCYNKCYKKKPTGTPYYCQIGVEDTCIKKYTNNKNNRYCGFHTMYETPAKIYNTLEECQNSNPYRNYTKEQCLKTNGVGWCSDYLGEGICVAGTPVGPKNMMKYYQCYPNQYRTDKNSWTYTKY